MTPTRTLTAFALAATLALAGCGGEDDPASADATTPTPSADASPSASATDGLTIEVTIADGAITPLGASYEAKPGETITLDVSSDTDDELHLHAEPEQSFEVAPGKKTYTFSVDVPGSVALESHEVGGTIATIDVRP